MLAGSWYVLLNYCSDREETAAEWQASPEDPGKRQIWVCHRTTAFVVPLILRRKSECLCVGVFSEQESEKWVFEAFFPGFLSTPKSQPCVRATFGAIPRYPCRLSGRAQRGRTCCALSVLMRRPCPAKPFQVGSIRGPVQRHRPQAGKNGEEKYGSANTIHQHSRRLHPCRDMVSRHQST